MAHNNHPTTQPQVPAEILAEHRTGWHVFTRYVTWGCMATAATLLLMLLFFKIL